MNHVAVSAGVARGAATLTGRLGGLAGKAGNPGSHTWDVTFNSHGTGRNEGNVPLLEVLGGIGLGGTLGGTAPTGGAFVAVPGYGPAVPLEVSNNDQDYTTGGAPHASFLYQPVVNLGKLYPVAGPSTGGTVLTLTLGFADGDDSGPYVFEAHDPLRSLLRCRFNRTSVRATVIGASQIRCTAPPHLPGFVSVDLTANGGGDYSTSKLSFEYGKVTSALTVWPRAGPVTGGTRLTVTSAGGSFVASDLVRCMFGGVVVRSEPRARRCRRR